MGEGVKFEEQCDGSKVGSDDTWPAGRDLPIESKVQMLLAERMRPVVYLSAGPQLAFAAEAQRQVVDEQHAARERARRRREGMDVVYVSPS